MLSILIGGSHDDGEPYGVVNHTLAGRGALLLLNKNAVEGLGADLATVLSLAAEVMMYSALGGGACSVGATGSDAAIDSCGCGSCRWR